MARCVSIGMDGLLRELESPEGADQDGIGKLDHGRAVAMATMRQESKLSAEFLSSSVSEITQAMVVLCQCGRNSY
jgi:hypothetical protein